MFKSLIFFLVLLLSIQNAYALTEESLCRLPFRDWSYKKLVDKKDLYARIQKYDSKEYFLEYIYAHDNNWDTKPKRSLPPYLKMQKYAAYTGSHLSGIDYTFDESRDIRKDLQNTHIITDEERADIIMLINLAIDDTQKANEIFNELYAQYLYKVKNPEIWHHCDWSPVFAYVEYQGIYFQLIGTLYKDYETIIGFYYK